MCRTSRPAGGPFREFPTRPLGHKLYILIYMMCYSWMPVAAIASGVTRRGWAEATPGAEQRRVVSGLAWVGQRRHEGAAGREAKPSAVLLPRPHGEWNVRGSRPPLAVIEVGENPVGPSPGGGPEGGVQTLRLNEAFRVPPGAPSPGRLLAAGRCF